MESKLKALKVVDLKDILAKASVAVTGKANKPDLIAKILASPDAVAVYNQLHGGGAAELSQGASPAPPAATAKSAPPPKPPIKSTSSSPAKAAPAPSPPKPASQAAPKAPDASAAVAKPTEAPPAPAENEEAAAKDDEAEKRKARAARFGIPVVENPADAEAERRKARAERFGIAVVEPKAAPTAGPKGKRGAVKGKGKGAQPAAAGEDAEKIAARAARFGTQAPTNQPKSVSGKKRSAPANETVDAEELERRKKRAERFGTVKS